MNLLSLMKPDFFKEIITEMQIDNHKMTEVRYPDA